MHRPAEAPAATGICPWIARRTYDLSAPAPAGRTLQA
jgi:hypothetical protein